MSDETISLYYKIKEARKNIIAPVDTMGCASILPEITGDNKKLCILVSLLLSSQTKDQVTHAVVRNLHSGLPEDKSNNNGLTIENIRASSLDYIKSLICKVGFYNKKSQCLKQIADICSEVGMPETIEDVTKLPGIGSKMGYLYLQHACNKNMGIGVDTHVHRLANRIGLVNTKTPEQTRLVLETVISKDEWKDINTVLVGYGQVVCQPLKPKCSNCVIREGCPSSLF